MGSISLHGQFLCSVDDEADIIRTQRVVVNGHYRGQKEIACQPRHFVKTGLHSTHV